MALVKCKECGHEVSKKAKRCPNCGGPPPPKQYGFWHLFLILFIGWIFFGVSDTDAVPDKRTPPIKRSLSSSSFPEPWPFTVPQGTVSCDPRGAITFTAGGKTYGINGFAKTNGFPSPDEIWKLDPTYQGKIAEYAEALKISEEEARKKIVPTRISIGPVLDAGLALCR